MLSKVIGGFAGLLLFAAAVGVQAQGGGQPVSPAQASEIVARKASDKRLAAAVIAALSETRIDVSRVKVKAYDGAVTIRGSVPTEEQRKAASSAVMSVKGVTSVKSQLSLRR